MLRLDADVRNADWVKTRTWDLPTTLEELLVTIGGKSGIPRLLASPVAEAMPPALRAQVTATTMTLPALKAYRADLQRLLGGFLQVDEKLRHVRDADYWGAPVGTPLPLPDGMKIRVPQPVCDELTSLDALPDVLQEFVNNSGTPDNPAHRREFKKAGKTIDVSVNDVVAHINETLDGVDEGTWQEGEQWYQKAHDECVVPWAKEFDVPEEVVAGVIAAISPRMPWDKNVEVAHELIRLWREEDDFGGLPDMDAARSTPQQGGRDEDAGLSDNVVQAIRCLRTGDVDKSVSGTKRRSFANNLYDPTAGYDVCNDGWMASMVNRMYPDAGFTAAECDPWLGHTKTISKQEQPGPGGYVIIAEAVRKIAEKRDLLPCQVQAIYWIAVGGGTNKPMYPNAKKEKKAARVVRSSWPFTDVANDPTGGDLTDPDYFDAEALRGSLPRSTPHGG